MIRGDEMGTDLDALIAEVSDEATFIVFLEALARDFAQERELEASQSSLPYSPGPLGWENGTVDAVFAAAAAWGHDAHNAEQPRLSTNTWQRCAQIIYAGKGYE